MFDFKN